MEGGWGREGKRERGRETNIKPSNINISNSSEFLKLYLTILVDYINFRPIAAQYFQFSK